MVYGGKNPGLRMKVHFTAVDDLIDRSQLPDLWVWEGAWLLTFALSRSSNWGLMSVLTWSLSETQASAVLVT
jgi:hypothetical protein